MQTIQVQIDFKFILHKTTILFEIRSVLGKK